MKLIWFEHPLFIVLTKDFLEMLESGVYGKEQADLISILEGLLRETLPRNVGCITTFMGITRQVGIDGKQVSHLMMESYENHANRALKQICREVREKYGVEKVLIYHLVGQFEVGDPIVLVIVVSGSRKEAFHAIQEAVERYKREPALFKKEVYIDGSQAWISHS